MSAAHPEQMRLVPATPPRAARRPGRRVAAAAAFAASLVALGTFGWPRSRGVGGLPGEERAALLSRTVDELRQYCGPGHPPALDDHCRELASFAARFEECRGECETQVRRWLTPVPTR